MRRSSAVVAEAEAPTPGAEGIEGLRPGAAAVLAAHQARVAVGLAQAPVGATQGDDQGTGLLAAVGVIVGVAAVGLEDEDDVGPAIEVEVGACPGQQLLPGRDEGEQGGGGRFLLRRWFGLGRLHAGGKPSGGQQQWQGGAFHRPGAPQPWSTLRPRPVVLPQGDWVLARKVRTSYCARQGTTLPLLGTR